MTATAIIYPISRLSAMVLVWILVRASSTKAICFVCIISSICEPIVLVIESHLVSHALPLVIKDTSVLRPHILVLVSALLGSTVAADSLSDNFAALVIQHPLMGHFLVSRPLILVHLVAFDDTIAITESALGFGLVGLAHRVTVLVNLGRSH